ncbi:unnamed protein product [Paramecium primaurelia]|uniref:Uncharacterized protein n=1 Tax=Paramecium primaurelia TaxID=5886 RepID=A0A8S1PDA1_PARPR|nr:unnamed protein product [Paramecium primaurelia]
MQSGQLLNLQRLERQYLQTLSQNGWESPVVVNAAVEFANTLLRDGRSLIKQGNNPQAEMFFNRAKEITTPISITSGIFYTANFVRARGNAILQIVQLYEQQNQYQKAWMNIKEVLPFMEKFAYSKRININEDDKNVLKVYVQLLFHGCEVCRMMHRKDDMLDQCNKYVEILHRLGITFESLRNLTKDEFHQEYKKWFLMLAKAFYYIGKSQFKVGFERESLSNLYKSQQIFEIIYGMDAPATIKAKDKYEKLSQKMEFDMIMAKEKVDFQQFKEDLQKDVGQELLKKVVTLKPNKTFNHHIIQQVKSYQQIVGQLSQHTTKYQMPEYVQKVRIEYEDKLRTISFQQKYDDSNNKYKQYQIKNKKLSSRAVSTYNQSFLPQDRLFSPKLSSNATQSKRTSLYQLENHMDQLKEQLYTTELKKDTMDELLLSRPMIKSEYVLHKKKNDNKQNESAQPIKNLNKKKFKSSRLIPRILNKQSTQNIHIKSDSQQSEQKIHKMQTIQDQNFQQQNDDLHMPTTESLLQQQQQQQQQIIQVPFIQKIQTEVSEQKEYIYTDLLNKYTMDQLNLAASIIQSCYRKYSKTIKQIQSVQTIELTPINLPKPINVTQISEKVESQQTGRNQMKVSVKDMKNSFRRRNFGFDSIVREIKNTDSDQSSSNKAKTLVQIIKEFYNLPEQELYFLSKLFFDSEIKIWKLSNICVRAFSDANAQNLETEEQEQIQNDISPSEIQHQLQYIMNIFADVRSIKALQLIVYFRLSNDKQHYTLNFKINNFASYLDEYQRWFSKDRLQNFNGLLSIYCKQQSLYQSNKCNVIVFQSTEIAQEIVSKLLYAIKNHYYLIRSVVGFKIITMKDVISNQLQHEIIDIRSYYKNKQIEKENKRQMLLKQLKMEPIKIVEHQKQELPSISSSRNKRQLLFNDEIQYSREQSIIIQESDDNKSDQSKIITSQSPSDQKHFSNHLQSIENISEKDIIQEIPLRNPKKQYSVIHNRNTMTSPRFDSIISSQAVIRNPIQRKTHGSQFLEFSRKQKLDLIKQEEFNLEPPISKQSLDEQIRDRSNSDIQFLNDYLSEFHFANLADFEDYQPKEGPILSFKNQFNYKSTYFPPRGLIIYPEPEPFLPEYPDSFIMLNVTLKQDKQIKTGFVLYEEGQVYLIIDNREGNVHKQILQIDPGIRLPNRQKKLEILKHLIDKPDNSQRLSIVQELQQYNYRHTLIMLQRYVRRMNHYDEYIQNEIHQSLCSNNIIPSTSIKCLNYSDKIVSLQLLQNDIRTETEEGIQIIIETGIPQSNEELIDSKSFHCYRSKFNINKNKFYYYQTNLSLKVEVCFRETKILDTKLLYLSEQQAKQDLIVLKKNMHQFISHSKLLVKILLYNPNQKQYFYRTIDSLQDIEKMLHIFIKPQLIGYQIKSQAKIQRRLIGRALQFNRQVICLEDRNRDKFSALDQFLLMYIIDPLQFIKNENHRLLKSTILFYYFKQQLKLTLISSSRLRYFMKTYFHRKTFNAQSRVSNIGKVFVECEVYQFNKFYSDQQNNDHTYFYFQITPQESRTKVFKLVLDFADIKSICNKVVLQNCFKDKVLHQIIKILTAYLVCYRTNTYHGIKIPLSYIASQSKYDLHNTFTEVTYGSNILEEQQNARSSHPKLSILISDPMLRKKSQAQIMDVQIDNLQMPEEANKVLKNTTMLTPIFRGQKFIYKTTKIVNNMYVIITISYLSLNKFQIGLYIPQTCRNFSCYISSNDFQNMNPVFLESIFPSNLVTKETIDQFYINRWKFSEMNKIFEMAVNHPDEFEDFYSEMRSQARAIPQSELQKLTESRVSINNEDEFLEKQYDETPKLLESFSDQSRQNARSSTQPPIFVKKQFSKQFSVQNSIGQSNPQRLSLPTSQFQQKTDKSLFYRNSPRVSNQCSMENLYQSDKDLFFNQILVRKNNLDMISTFEIKIWESLIDKVQITKNSQNRFILNLDTFKGVLRENLYTQVVYLGNEVNALFEVFVENIRKPFNMLKPYMPIRLNESQNYQLYQRITLFEQPQIVNFKLMLRKVLYSYYNDERRNLQNLKLNDCSVDQYEFIESDIQKCSVYMLNKLKKQLKLNPSKFIVQEVQGDEKCPQVIKVNANYEQYSSFKCYQYTLLKRMVFTMRPTLIYVSIFYQEKRKKFWLYFESMKNCKNTTVKYNLKDIQHCIPNAIGLLNLGLHQELGNRIYRSFKNRLLVSTHQQLL